MLSIHGPHVTISAIDLGPALTIQFAQFFNILSFNCSWTAWYLNENYAAVVVYCHLYLDQYLEYLEVDLIDAKATNPKQEKIFLVSARD